MLEGRTGTRFDERRGRHLLAAGNQEMAMDILLEAARERRESSDIAIAERLLDQHADAMRSLGLPPTDPRGVQNQLQRARICLMQQEFDASEGWATQVEKTAREQSQPDALAEILTVRALIATAKGDLAQATGLLDEAEGIEGVDTRVRSGLQVAKATVLVRRGEFARSAEYSQRALEGFESVGDLKGAGQAHRALALYLRDRSRYNEERSHLQSALECFQAFGMRRGMADVLNDLGESSRHEGDLVQADAHYKSSVELFRSLGDPDLAIPRLNRGLVMFERGRHQHARLYLEGCLETYRHQGRKSLQAMTHVSLLGCCAALSDWKACDAHMTWSQVLLGQTGLVAEDIANMAQFTAEAAQSQERTPLAKEAWSLARDQWAALGHQGRADAIGARVNGS
jgi:tetratricopeptide (TPR) repeat protein